MATGSTCPDEVRIAVRILPDEPGCRTLHLYVTLPTEVGTVADIRFRYATSITFKGQVVLQ